MWSDRSARPAPAPGSTLSARRISRRSTPGSGEIPKYTRHKMEVSTELEGNPLVQDTKKGKLRDYHGPLYWNYGMLPQTWEDPAHHHDQASVSSFGGDGDPLDALEISSGEACEMGECVLGDWLAFFEPGSGSELIPFTSHQTRPGQGTGSVFHAGRRRARLEARHCARDRPARREAARH